jgi:hypothetical protein
MCEAYKNLILSNIVNQPKSWFTNIKELAESSNFLDIYILENTLTYNLLIKHSNSDSQGSIYFKQLLDRVKAVKLSEIQNFDKLKDLCHGNNAIISNSLKGELIFDYRAECDLSVNDLKYDQMNVISNDERARCSCSVLGRNEVLGKIKVLSARFFKVLEHRARTEH